LTQEEQFALAAVSEWQAKLAEVNNNGHALKEERARLAQEYGPVLRFLETKGLCWQLEQDWQISGELVAEYIRRVGPSSKGRLWVDEQTEVICQGLTPVKLSPQQDGFLRFLIKHPYKRHTYDNLLDLLYQGPDRIERGPPDIQALVRDLRRKIEVQPSEPRYLVLWGGGPKGGYQLYPEGRPQEHSL
jgi:hypothetical protein